MIELNQTLFFQVIGYFVLLIILNRFLYQPLLRVLKERDDKTGGALKGATDADREIEEGMRAYERKLKEAAVKGHEERNRLRQEALDKEKAVLEAARNEAAAGLSSIRTELGKSRESALAALKDETKAISKSIAEKILERKVVAFLLFFGLSLIPAVCRAAEEGGHEGGGMSFVWKVVNFIILAIVIVLVWKKGIQGLIAKRSDDIRKAMEEAQGAKALAEKRSAEYRDKLAMLDAKVAEIQRELRLEGEAEKERMMAEAARAAEKIKEQAKLAAEQEIKKARMEIRKEVSGLAVKMAGEILKKELTPADQERLVKGYLENLRLN